MAANTVNSIGENALIDSILDGSVTEIVDDRVTRIGEYALSARKSLVKADFPNVTSIGKYAFSSCTAFTTLILRSTTMVTLDLEYIFMGAPDVTVGVYVPSALVNTYKADSKWKTVLANDNPVTKIYAIESYPNICG